MSLSTRDQEQGLVSTRRVWEYGGGEVLTPLRGKNFKRDKEGVEKKKDFINVPSREGRGACVW